MIKERWSDFLKFGAKAVVGQRNNFGNINTRLNNFTEKSEVYSSQILSQVLLQLIN